MKSIIIAIGLSFMFPVFAFSQSLELLGRTNLSYCTDIAVENNYAYILTLSQYFMTVVDISDPSSPVVVGGYRGGNSYYRAIFAQGNYVFIAGQYDFEIIDVSDPAHPDSISSLPLSGISLGGGYGVAVEGNYAYVDDCGAGLRIIDISNPLNPVQLSQLTIPGGT